MKKFLLTLLLITLCATNAMAQNRSKVTFYLFDEKTKEPLQGAVVEIAPIDEPQDKSYYTFSHWDGDTKLILKYAQETGLDGIEAITPKPQGDVTLEEIKAGLGDKVGLVDGIAAILFDDMYPIEMLEEQARRLIDLFAGKLILGISDEMSSSGNIDRIRYITELVDKYNSTC